MASYTPLLMEHQGNDNEIFPVSVMQSENETHNRHIIIDMQRSDDNVPSSSNHQEHVESRRIDDADDDATQKLQSSSGLNSPNDESHEDSTPRANSEPNSRSPFISRLWILFELCIVVIQILTLSIALLVSRHEKIGVHLFVWVVGYALGCIAAVPVLCWHYYNISNTIEPNANWFDPNVSSRTHALEDGALNVSSSIDVENQHRMDSASSTIPNNGNNSLRFSRKMSGALDAFFAVWFIYGNVCLLGGYASPVDSPIIYELCLIFVTLSYIGYAMPLILCATICCFLPCIVTAIESQEEQYQTRGATAESIDALPTFTFKLKGNNNDQDFDLEQKETSALASQKNENEGLGQDLACCCVCLAEFEDDEEMRELPCSHFFHVDCIDTWLKINATCPLCKFEIGLSGGESPPTTNSNHPNS